RATITDTVSARGLRHPGLPIDLGDRTSRLTLPVFDGLLTGRALIEASLTTVSGRPDPACRTGRRMMRVGLHRLRTDHLTVGSVGEQNIRRIPALRSVVVLRLDHLEVTVDTVATRFRAVVGVPVLPHRLSHIGIGA